MSRNNENPGRLSARDRELVALGAAIASNCIPCVEYHVPQARKAGLSDTEIGEAVALADNVRRVPAARVLQTATALVSGRNRTPREDTGRGCGCTDGAGRSAGETATERDEDVRVDGAPPENDNEARGACDGEGAENPSHARYSDKTTAGAQNATDAGFDLWKMMEEMRRCCPDRMSRIAEMMSDFEKGRGRPHEDAGSADPA